MALRLSPANSLNPFGMARYSAATKRASFDVAHLRWNFLFYLTKQVKIEKYEALQYKPDAQARDREILGNIPSLARRARISATSKSASE